MPITTINNRSLFYHDEGQGPAILFGHSYLWDGSMWQAQVAALSQRFRCIVPDLWGHGQSDPLDEAPTVESLAHDYWQLMQQLQVDRFSVVGLSVGGMWGTQLALDHVESVNKLVLMDTFVGAEPERTRMQYLHMLDTVAQMQQVPDPMITQLLPLFLAQQTLQDKPEIARQFTQLLKQVPVEKIATVVALGRSIFNRKDNMHRLTELVMPVMIVTGEFDIPRPVDEARQMVAQIEGAKCHIVSDAGHISALEQPGQVNTLLTAFL